MRYEIDLAAAPDRTALHELLKQKLDLPEWYGGNLDALHDILCEGSITGELVFQNASAAPEGMQSYFASLRRMCEDVPSGLNVIWEDKAAGDPFINRVMELRRITDRHYNCAQSVVVPFAEAAGVDEELLFRVAANFGGGMKRSATCGAVTGGLMVLGLFGLDDPQTLKEFYGHIRGNHDGNLECAYLLKAHMEHDGEKSAHCDSIICESVLLVEELLRKNGKI